MHTSLRIALLFLIATSGTSQQLLAADPPADYSFSGGDGSTTTAAVIVHARNEVAGVHAEYAWIKEHWPGSRRKNQGLMMKGERSYDAITITDSAGQERVLYFDITEYFGKY